MRTFLRLLLLVLVLPVLARPVVIEPVSTIAVPDSAYAAFGFGLAIDGDFALASGSRTEEFPGSDPQFRNWQTFWLLQRNGTQWNVVRKLPEYLDDVFYPRNPAAAMQNGIAAVQTGNHLDFYELGAGGWTLANAEVEQEAPDRWLRIDAGRVISGEGGCRRDGRVFAREPVVAQKCLVRGNHLGA